MPLFGITRENISHNALGIGLMVGCIVGSWAAPKIVAPEAEGDPSQHILHINTHNQVGSHDTEHTNSTINTSALHNRIQLHGYLGVYISALTSFPSLQRYDQWWVLIVTILLVITFKLLYQWFCRPFEYARVYDSEKRLEAAYLRLAGNVPPGYPNTWYKVCDEFDVPKSLTKGDGVFRIDLLGEQLLIFRTPKKHPFGDDVKEGEIVVLVEGSLKNISGDIRSTLLSSSPSSQSLDTTGWIRWKSIEINRMIFVWHHDFNAQPSVDAHSTADVIASVRDVPVPPQWEIPPIPGMGDFVYHGRVSHEIACHIQEIPENGADVAHLDYIHGNFLLSWLTPVRHTWEATWDPQHEPIGHIAKLQLNQQVSIFGVKIPFTSLDSHVHQIGPGLVHLIFETPFGRVAVIETIAPICHTLQRAHNALYSDKTVPRFLAKVRNLNHDWSRSLT